MLLAASDQLIRKGLCARPRGRSQKTTLEECSRQVGVLLVDWILETPKLTVKLEQLVST